MFIVSCEKDVTGPNPPGDPPPPPPPKKALVVIANFTIQDPPQTEVFGYFVAIEKEDGIVVAVLGSQEGTTAVFTGDQLDMLYGSNMLGVAEYSYVLGGCLCYGIVEPDSVTFIAKDTIRLSFVCRP